MIYNLVVRGDYMEKHKLSELSRTNFSQAVDQIYMLTDYNTDQYPDYYKWFYGKSIPRIFTETGEIIFYLDAFTIVGLTVLKRDTDEKKICTLMINSEYRMQGYAKELLEDAYNFLGTTKPVITIPEFRMSEFDRIIEEYGWVKSGETGIYRSNEIIFNGKEKGFGKDIKVLQQIDSAISRQ